MTVNLKADDFERSDLHALGNAADMGSSEVDHIIDEVAAAADRWPEFAEHAGVTHEHRAIHTTFRTFH